MSTPTLADISVSGDWKSIVFLVTTAAVFLNALLLERIDHERVLVAKGVKPVVMWVLCCFRTYFRFIIILSALAAFLIALAALVIGLSLFATLAWIVVLLVVSFGAVLTHRHTIEEAVDWEVLKGK